MRHPIRPLIRLLLFAIACFGLTIPASAQGDPPKAAGGAGDDARPTVTNAGPLIPFLEGTDVFVSLREDTVFEADILPHFVAFQNFSDVIDIAEQSRRAATGVKTFAVSISGTPAVRIRMFDQVSRPVRTPSYMPRGNFQLIWARNVAAVTNAFVRTSTAGSIAAAGEKQVSLWEAHAIVGHHSNGQDGCFYQDEERIDEVCVSVQPIVDERVVNKQDGSFSTNYVRVGINYRRNLLDDELWAKREWGGRLDVEYHPRPWMAEEIVDLLQDDPGRARRQYRHPGDRLVSQACRSHGGDQVYPRTSRIGVARGRHGTGLLLPDTSGGLGCFRPVLRWPGLLQPGLLDNIQRIHVGATFNQSGFFRFRRPNQGEGSGGAAADK